MQNRFVASVGTGAGFYQGFIKLTGGTNHVKSIAFHFIESTATSGNGSQFEIDLRSGNFDTKMPLSGTSFSQSTRNKSVYPSPNAVPTNSSGSTHDNGYGLRADKFDAMAGVGGMQTSNRLYSGHQSINMPFVFTYSGTASVNLFIRAQGDSGTDSCTVEARFVKFGT